MKPISPSTILALALAACIGAAHPASAAEQVPFKGSLAGTVTVTPVMPPFVDVFVEASGDATQLGEFLVVIPHTVNRGTVPPSAAGTYTFVAANGDELHADFTGKSMLIGPGLLFIDETATITGGTGRFAGATGGFVCARLFDQVAGSTVGEFSGTISSVGSK